METRFYLTKEEFEELINTINENKDSKKLTIFNKRLGDLNITIDKQCNNMYRFFIYTNGFFSKDLKARLWTPSDPINDKSKKDNGN